jgi:diketogulonate reductase-like aldo/keto reductase
MLRQLKTARNRSERPVVVSQVLYPYKRQSALRQYRARHDIALIADSPLARGDAVLKRIGDQYDSAGLAPMSRPAGRRRRHPESDSREDLTRNLDIFDFSLTGEEMRRIDERTGPVRVCHRNTLRRLVRRIPV